MSPAAWPPGRRRGTPSKSRRKPATSRVRIGTSGYVYKDWRGLVYPEAMPPREWLGFYARLDVYVYFNNDFHGHAWRNARALAAML